MPSSGCSGRRGLEYWNCCNPIAGVLETDAGSIPAGSTRNRFARSVSPAHYSTEAQMRRFRMGPTRFRRGRQNGEGSTGRLNP